MNKVVQWSVLNVDYLIDKWCDRNIALHFSSDSTRLSKSRLIVTFLNSPARDDE
jgi:hypothetical protein